MYSKIVASRNRQIVSHSQANPGVVPWGEKIEGEKKLCPSGISE